MIPAPPITTAMEICSQASIEATDLLSELAAVHLIAWDDTSLQEQAQADLSTLFTDPRRADEINDALAYLEALSEMTAKEIARQQARQRAIEEAAYQIQREVLNALEQAQQTALHGQHCTLRRRLNPPSVRILDPAAIPAQYMRQPPPPPAVADKTAIRAALDAGAFVPGAVVTRGARLERK